MASDLLTANAPSRVIDLRGYSSLSARLAVRPSAAASAHLTHEADFSGPMQLTKRGRRIVGAFLVAVLCVVFFVLVAAFGASSADATAHGGSARGHSVVVSQGETLWSLAEESAAPGEDVRDVVLRIKHANSLGNSLVLSGQTLFIPDAS